MVRVLLAEDHNIVRQGTRLYLENMGVDVIGEATNGREAVDMARDIARISSPALRKQVAEAIRTLLTKYFE